MNYLTAYLIGTVAFMALMAVRTPDTEVRPAFVLCALWPASILAVVLVFFWGALGWNVDVFPGEKNFGFRKPTNGGIKGFAVTLFGKEIQVWKELKV